jgi:hypothetical protein
LPNYNRGGMNNGNGNGNGNSKGKGKNGNKKNSSAPKLSAKELAVIAAILTNSLVVKSLLVDTDKTVQIVLEGTLLKKTKLDDLLEEINDYSIGDIITAFQNNQRR